MANVHYVGELGKPWKEVCYICGDTYYMTCMDHLFKHIGYTLPDNGWVCPKCGEEILRIKNL